MGGRVHVSLPLTGPSGGAGRDILRGAELELERAGRPVELVVLDAAGADRDEQAEANARRAAADGDALAYLGDLHSSQVWRTAPLLADAGLLAVAPAATWTELHGPTLVRLMPHDGVLARAIAAWLVATGVRELLVVHDHDEWYGAPVGTLCAMAARERGLDVRARPVWDHDEPMTADVGGAGAVLYVGVAGSGAVGLWHDLHAHDPRLWLLGTDRVAAPWLAAALSEGAAERTRFFGAQLAARELYGAQAMALILDAVAEGAGDRAATVRAARSTRERHSLLGRYAIDADGLTTATACGCRTVVDGVLVWARERPGAAPS